MVHQIAKTFLLVISIAFIAFCAGRYETFPYGIIAGVVEDIEAFISEDPSDLSLVDKLANDMNLIPTRFFGTEPIPQSDRNYTELQLEDINSRRDSPQVYISKQQKLSGYYLLSGIFDFNDGLHGAVLLSNKGEVINTWHYNDEHLVGLMNTQVNSQKKHAGDSENNKHLYRNRYPHGMVAMPDGSLVITTNFGMGIQRFNWCGEQIWSIPGDYHHSIEATSDYSRGWFISKWEPDELMLVEIDLINGKILRKIPISKVKRANPNIDIFGIKQRDKNADWLFDPYHPNNVEELPEKYNAAFPLFDAGDLLVSFRSLNMVFVMDPDSLKIKWWRMGLTRRQHDPDWQPDGTITVFDNNMNRGFSRIKQISPDEFSARIIYDGKRHKFYTSDHGEHSVLPNGNLLITSTQQGRVFEVTPQGDIVFEFYNFYDSENDKRLLVTAAEWLAPDFINPSEMKSCSN